MTDDTPDRALRAFRRHDSLTDPEETDGDGVTVTSTPFDARITAGPGTDGRLTFDVTVAVPTLSAVTADSVAPVVEDGWAETFQLRVEDIGAVTEGTHDLSPSVERDGDRLVVTATLSDLDHDRGTNDAVAVVDYVEGTYVQGVVPGYDYTEPVDGLIQAARATGGSA